MENPSKTVSSKQQATHPRLPELLARYRSSRWQEPLAPHNAQAIAQLDSLLSNDQRPLVLDSFCGTGLSTQLLAARHRDCLVVGIDKSGHRLAKTEGDAGQNYVLLRAECEPIWRHLAQNGRTLAAHYLLYPNPWPKPGHLQRRVHGHPAFSELISLGGNVEVRSNWQLYIEEFGLAMSISGHCGRVSRVDAGEPLTLFERKYRDSGHALWSFIANIPV